MLKLLRDHGKMTPTERGEFIQELMEYGQLTQNEQIKRIAEDIVKGLGNMGEDLAIEDVQGVSAVIFSRCALKWMK